MSKTNKSNNSNENGLWSNVAIGLFKKGQELDESGSWGEALEYYEKADLLVKMNINQTECLDWYPKMLNTIAECCKNLGRYEKSYSYSSEALKMSQMSGDRFQIAIFTFQVGLSLKMLARYDEASKYYEKALPLVRSYAPQFIVTVLASIAMLDDHLGNSKEALKRIEEAREISQAQDGKKSPSYAQVLNNLGVVLRSAEKYNEAIEVFKEALEIRKSIFGKRHPNYSMTLTNLSQTYFQMEKYEIALKYSSEALEIDKDCFGIDHPNYAISLNTFADIAQKSGKLEIALSMNQEALKIFTQSFGKNSEALVPTLQAVGFSLFALKRYSEALQKFDQALQLFKSTDMQSICKTTVAKARCIEHLGNPKKALSLLESFYPQANQKLSETNYEMKQMMLHIERLKTLPTEQQENVEKDLQDKKEIHIEKEKKTASAEDLCYVCKNPTTSRCSGCQKVAYCGRECQRSHWKEHKPKCKA